MKRLINIVVIVILASVVSPAFGQAGPGGPPGGMQMDPAAMRQMIQGFQQRMLDNVKTAIGSTDEEFQVIQPRLQKVMQLQTETALATAAGSGLGGQNPFLANIMAAMNAGQPPSDLQKATTDLQTAVSNKTTSAETITAKLAALRAARNAQKDKLTQAQNDLRDVLTQRQEAILVTMGML